jgi:glucose/mannose-6-phosphate isomerase
MAPITTRFDFAASLPDQIDHARKASKNLERLPDKERVEHIVVLGMGDSGIAGDLLRVIASPFVPVPITVVEGYELPAFVGEGSLVFAVSSSGETEEVIDAATDAAVQGAKMVVVSSGGRLCELGGSWGATLVRTRKPPLEHTSPIGELAIPMIAVLEEMGLFPGAGQWIDFAVKQLENRIIELQVAGSNAESLAEDLARKIVIVHGGGSVGAAAAKRWKSQINLNSQVPAFWAAHPSMDHDEIAGWLGDADWVRKNVAIVALRHDGEHPQISRRFDLVQEKLAPLVSDIHNVWAEGDGDLAQLLDLFVIGEFVSLHLANASNVEPTKLHVLDELKSALSDR